MADGYQWRRVAHIPALIILQIIFVILFAKFVVYDEHSAIKNVHFDAGYAAKHAKDGENAGDPDAKAEPADGLDHAHVDEKGATIEHETTRDAKEILTDYPSKCITHSLPYNTMSHCVIIVHRI